MHQDEPVVDSELHTDTWLTTSEAMERAKVGRKAIYRAIRRKKLRAAKMDGRGDYRFRPAWVDAWIEACAKPVEIR